MVAQRSGPRPVGDLFAPFFTVSFPTTRANPGSVKPFADSLTPFSQISLLNPPGLHVVGGPGDSNLDKLLLKINASLTAESSAGSPYHFTLTMTPEYDDALRIIESKILGYATIAVVQWGYVTSDGSTIVTKKHSFRNILPKIKFGEHITIVVEGFDSISSVATRRTINKEWKTESIFEIIEAIVKRVNPFTISRETAQQNVDPKHALFEKPKQSIQQNHTDWAFILYLIRRVALSFIIREDELVIFDPARPEAKNLVTAYEFRWRLPLTGANHIPVYSIDANYLNYMFQPPAGRGLKALCYNAETGAWTANDIDSRDIDGEVPTDSSSSDDANAPSFFRKPTDPPVAPPPTNEAGEGLTQDPEVSVDSEEVGTKLSCPSPNPSGGIPGIAKAIVKEAEIFGSPIVKLRAPGVVDMFPGLVVQLKGATSIFDAHYIVLTVKHTISNSGYDMDVTMYRRKTPRPGAPEVENKKDIEPVTDSGTTGTQDAPNFETG